jgi:hypothetical protein
MLLPLTGRFPQMSHTFAILRSGKFKRINIAKSPDRRNHIIEIQTLFPYNELWFFSALRHHAMRRPRRL